MRMHLRGKYHLAQVRTSRDGTWRVFPRTLHPLGQPPARCLLEVPGWEMAPEEGSIRLLSSPAPPAASLHPTVPV